MKKIACSACKKKVKNAVSIEGRLDIVCGVAFCINQDHWTTVTVPVCEECRNKLVGIIQERYSA